MIERWVIARLARWVAWVSGHAWITLHLLAVATVALSWVAVDRFQMSSNLKELIRQEAPWRDDFDRFQDAFPDYVKTAVVVVSGTAFKQVEDAAHRIEAEIRKRPDRFRAVYAGENHPFFRDHAFLYLDEEELDDMADRLAEAQPWLTSVAEDPSLRSVLDLAADGVENDPPSGFDDIVDWLETSARAVLAGADPTIYWTNEFFGSDETHYRLILLKSNLSIRETAANAEVVRELREILADVAPPPEVSVGITGEVALTHEEIEAAVGGLEMTGLLAIALLALVLIVGVRSIIIILATFALLGMGMAWTSAFAMLTVGEYNTLSIVFLVMFFGLGVDFALHFSLRYQEAMGAGLARVRHQLPAADADALALRGRAPSSRFDVLSSTPASSSGPRDQAGRRLDALTTKVGDGRGLVNIERALIASTRSVGGAIFICTVTTALGFLGFWPTDYRGLADLGVISAGGMVIAGFLTFTLLPAFYAVCRPVNPHSMDVPTSERLVGYLISHRTRVAVWMSLLLCGGIALASQARFDYSVLALKDPESESMRTLRTLQEDGRATDYALSILSDEPIETAGLEGLPVVDTVVSLAGFVPDDQDYKLFALADLQELLWSAIEPLRRLDEPSPDDLRRSLLGLRQAIDEFDAEGRFAGLREALVALEQEPPERLLAWQRGVIDNLVEELEWLRRALLVGPVEDADLPLEVRERMVNADGRHLTIVLPEENVAPVDALSRFIEAVRAEAPLATGRPVIEWGIGKIVVDSFVQAMIFALASIGLVLVLMFQSLRYAVLILVPLAMAVIFTLAIGVVFDWPLNMANILVFPLIFGLGVDNGVHVVDRYRGEGDVPRLMHSSTPRAVLLSTLTTVGTFVALSFSPHQGTASIGLLLAVAVSLLLLFTVFLLPVLLSWVSGKAA